jgi:hypothetical protein
VRHFVLSLFLVNAIPQFAVAEGWTYSHTTDQFTDKQQSSAQYIGQGQSRATVISVGCNETGIVLAVVAFNQFLGDHMVDVEYRFDKQQPVKTSWLASNDGTAVIAAQQRDFATQLASGEALIIRAWDFRGVAYTLSVPLTDAKEPVDKMLHDCHVAPVPIGTNSDLANIDKKVLLEVERWGPRNVTLNKQALKSLGFYSGAVDNLKDTQLYVAVQNFRTDFCRRQGSSPTGKIDCDSIPISIDIMNRAPREQREQLGKMRMGD